MTRKYLFKTFNRNMSALSVPPNVQSLFREIVETLGAHSSLIEKLTEAAETTTGLELSEIPNSSPQGVDAVQRKLEIEVFG